MYKRTPSIFEQQQKATLITASDVRLQIPQTFRKKKDTGIFKVWTVTSSLEIK